MKVDVIISILNGEKFIEESILSIINQTYTNWNLHLIDNGSIDDTFEILKKYKSLYKNKIFIERYDENLIPSTRWTQKIINSKAEFIAISCHDDIWKSDKLERQIKLIVEKKADLIHSNVNYINHLGEIIKNGSINENDYRNNLSYNNLNYIELSSELCKKNSIRLSTVLIRKTVFKKYGTWEAERWGGEDWGLWVKLAANKCKFFHIKQNLVFRRVNVGNSSSVSRYNRSFGLLKSFELVKNNYHFINKKALLKRENEIYERLVYETMNRNEFKLARFYGKYFLNKRKKKIRDYLFIIISNSNITGKFLMKLNSKI